MTLERREAGASEFAVVTRPVVSTVPPHFVGAVATWLEMSRGQRSILCTTIKLPKTIVWMDKLFEQDQGRKSELLSL